MQRKNKIVISAAAVLAVAGGTAAAAAGAGDSDTPITGAALQKATAAALAHTGQGRVTQTEVGDEESYYQVEVTLDNGSQVDVQLDRQFHVVGSSSDKEGADRNSGGAGDGG